MGRHNGMVGQINNLLCYFGMLTAAVKLMYAYCTITMAVSYGI